MPPIHVTREPEDSSYQRTPPMLCGLDRATPQLSRCAVHPDVREKEELFGVRKAERPRALMDRCAARGYVRGYVRGYARGYVEQKRVAVQAITHCFYWYARTDSNRRHPGSKPGTLSS